LEELIDQGLNPGEGENSNVTTNILTFAGKKKTDETIYVDHRFTILNHLTGIGNQSILLGMRDRKKR